MCIVDSRQQVTVSSDVAYQLANLAAQSVQLSFFAGQAFHEFVCGKA